LDGSAESEPSGNGTPLPLGRLVAVTITVADLAIAVDAYRTHLGYRLVESGYVPEALAQSWAAPQNADSRYALLSPAGGGEVLIRFVEGPIPENYVPLRSFGWAAAEIVVANVDALATRLRVSPFEIIAPPADLAFAGGALRAMSVRGPSAEVLIFTEIREAVGGFELPEARDEVDRPFIAVVGADDFAKARDFYRDKFLAPTGREFETPIRPLNDTFGLNEDDRHRVTTVNLPGQSYIEIDQYPEMAAKRRGEHGYLVPGIALVTFEGHGIDDLPLYWLSEPTAYDVAPYKGRRQVTFYGGAGEMIELIETG
jgi:catechol 2,3-dioxygenase-like lactoylglutathione lyase family enzyme